MSLTSKERKELRAEAHHLSIIVHVGKDGLTPTLLEAMDDALRAKELVKIGLTKGADDDVKTVANKIADTMGADVVQVIGKTATLYRENPQLRRKPGAAPPWRD
jgi:RNA-binding protein